MPIGSAKQEMLERENQAKFQDALQGRVSHDFIDNLNRKPEKCAGLVDAYVDMLRQANNKETKDVYTKNLLGIFVELNFTAQEYCLTAFGFQHVPWEKYLSHAFEDYFVVAKETVLLRDRYLKEVSALRFNDIENFSDDLLEKDFLRHYFTQKHSILPTVADTTDSKKQLNWSVNQQRLNRGNGEKAVIKNPSTIAEIFMKGEFVNAETLEDLSQNPKKLLAMAVQWRMRFFMQTWSAFSQDDMETHRKYLKYFIQGLQCFFENKDKRAVVKILHSFTSYAKSKNPEDDRFIALFFERNAETFTEIIRELGCRPQFERTLLANLGVKKETTIRGKVESVPMEIRKTEYKEQMDEYFKKRTYNPKIVNGLKEGNEEMIYQLIVSFFDSFDLEGEIEKAKRAGEKSQSNTAENEVIRKQTMTLGLLAFYLPIEKQAIFFYQLSQFINRLKEQNRFQLMHAHTSDKKVLLLFLISFLHEALHSEPDHKETKDFELYKKAALNAFQGKFNE